MKKRSSGGCIYKQKGSANWWIKFHLNGKAHAQSTGSPDHAVAEKLLAKKMAQKTLNQLEPDADRVKFEDIVSLVINDYKVNQKRSLDRVERGLKHLGRYFGGLKAKAIRSDSVDRYILARLDEGAANATVNRELATLKRAFSLAIKKGKLHQKPVISMLQEDNVRSGFFSPAEFSALRHALPDYLRPVATFAFYTGWRKGELLSLQWNQVSLPEKTVRLEPGTTKNRAGRVIVLDGELLDVIQAQWEKRKVAAIPGQSPTTICPYVFHHDGKQIKDFRAAWKTATAKVGLSGKLFHDNRRSAIKNMVKAGVREKVAMQISGHKTRSVFDRYHIVDEDEIRDATRRTAEHIQSESNVAVVSPLNAKVGQHARD